MKKALVLISGGLDSLLAAKLIMDQGVHVEGINFYTGFTGVRPHHVGPIFTKDPTAKPKNAVWVAEQLGIKLHVVDLFESFKAVLLKPKYGYGANINPCLDCKLFMIVKAKEWMEQHGFDFLITGEVVGQRPMSQRTDTLPLAVKLTDDRIVRPLSAKLLEPTLPEREGWIKRELLCDFSGRSRKPQIALAAKYGFKEFPQPGGGCDLTEPNFCKRLQELWQFRKSQDYTFADIQLLKIGRHINFSSTVRLIIGRDQAENTFLEKFATKHILLQAVSHPGAMVLVEGEPDDLELFKIAALAAYYSKGKSAAEVEVMLQQPLITPKKIIVVPKNI